MDALNDRLKQLAISIRQLTKDGQDTAALQQEMLTLKAQKEVLAKEEGGAASKKKIIAKTPKVTSRT